MNTTFSSKCLLLFLDLLLLLLSVLPVVLDIGQSKGTDGIVLVQDKFPQLGNVIVAPFDLLKVVLSHGFSENEPDCLVDVLGCLAVFYRKLQIFVNLLFPKCDEGGQVLFVLGVWKWVAGKILVVKHFLS